MKYPIAYFITFTTYGTWLHGDKRGSIDKEHNRYGTAFIAQNDGLNKKEQCALKNAPFILDESRRGIVLKLILQVCIFRGWVAHAVHVRSNHIHIVVSGRERPEKMMVDFKIYATRAIREYGNGQMGVEKYWARHGSTKYLFTKESLDSAITYVKNEQGEMMSFGATEKMSPERK